LELQQLVRKIQIDDAALDVVLRLVRATRNGESDAPEQVTKWLSWGAGPRASQNLVLGAKSVAALDGRNKVKVSDVFEVAHPVLGHRIQLNFAAQAEGMTTKKMIDELIKGIA
jgi:MoxR-like ATPase